MQGERMFQHEIINYRMSEARHDFAHFPAAERLIRSNCNVEGWSISTNLHIPEHTVQIDADSTILWALPWAVGRCAENRNKLWIECNYTMNEWISESIRKIVPPTAKKLINLSFILNCATNLKFVGNWHFMLICSAYEWFIHKLLLVAFWHQTRADMQKL